MMPLVLRGGQRCLLIWDSTSIHSTINMKKSLAERQRDQIMIPTGMTSYLPTLDITRHSRTICAYKAHMQAYMETDIQAHMQTHMQAFMKTYMQTYMQTHMQTYTEFKTMGNTKCRSALQNTIFKGRMWYVQFHLYMELKPVASDSQLLAEIIRCLTPLPPGVKHWNTN